MTPEPAPSTTREVSPKGVFDGADFATPTCTTAGPTRSTTLTMEREYASIAASSSAGICAEPSPFVFPNHVIVSFAFQISQILTTTQDYSASLQRASYHHFA